jgi:hypothetical protein
MKCLCLHLNRNNEMPASFIYNLYTNNHSKNEVFLGFVDFKDYK